MNTKNAIKNISEVPIKFDKAGGTISGTISKNGEGQSWLTGAQGVGCIINMTTVDAYTPMIRQKSKVGAWTFGVYNNEEYLLSYVSDSNIAKADDRTTGQIRFPFNVHGTVYTTGNKPSPSDIGASPAHDHPYISTSASCNKNWNWSGQEGQPTWLWGGSEPNNMYLYNPSNFRVNYANSADRCNNATEAGWSANTDKVKGKNIFIQQGQPSGQVTGDVWISW